MTIAKHTISRLVWLFAIVLHLLPVSSACSLDPARNKRSLPSCCLARETSSCCSNCCHLASKAMGRTFAAPSCRCRIIPTNRAYDCRKTLHLMNSLVLASRSVNTRLFGIFQFEKTATVGAEPPIEAQREADVGRAPPIA
jgi:hypothetical protein